MFFILNVLTQMKQIQTLHKQQEETKHDLDKSNVRIV